MIKYIGFLMSLFLMGVVHAAEEGAIADAPLPEPNYVGIIVFLLISVGCCIWFMWKVMKNKGDGN